MKVKKSARSSLARLYYTVHRRVPPDARRQTPDASYARRQTPDARRQTPDARPQTPDARRELPWYRGETARGCWQARGSQYAE